MCIFSDDNGYYGNDYNGVDIGKDYYGNEISDEHWKQHKGEVYKGQSEMNCNRRKKYTVFILISSHALISAHPPKKPSRIQKRP